MAATSALPRAPLLATHRRTIHLDHDPYAVRLAVRYVENAIAVGEYAVRLRQRASKRIGLGTVTSVTGSDDCCDDAGIECDVRIMALSVGHIEPAAPMGQSPPTRELSKRATFSSMKSPNEKPGLSIWSAGNAVGVRNGRFISTAIRMTRV
jgi:hypothetical protein